MVRDDHEPEASTSSKQRRTAAHGRHRAAKMRSVQILQPSRGIGVVGSVPLGSSGDGGTASLLPAPPCGNTGVFCPLEAGACTGAGTVALVDASPVMPCKKFGPIVEWNWDTPRGLWRQKNKLQT